MKNNIAAVIASVNVPYLWHKAVNPAPTIDYTLYWGSIEPDSWQRLGTTYLTFPSWQSGSGQDAHGMLANPKFTNASAGDLSLQTGSPALNTGGDLTLTSSAGSGTLIPVQDARYFSAGYDMVAGDLLQVAGQVTQLNGRELRPEPADRHAGA